MYRMIEHGDTGIAPKLCTILLDVFYNVPPNTGFVQDLHDLLGRLFRALVGRGIDDRDVLPDHFTMAIAE